MLKETLVAHFKIPEMYDSIKWSFLNYFLRNTHKGHKKVFVRPVWDQVGFQNVTPKHNRTYNTCANLFGY
jgi:hypothetical protein